MTLLTTNDLKDSVDAIGRLEPWCRDIAGATPYEIACRAVNVQPVDRTQHQDLLVACVPITAGVGILGTFCHIVADVVRRFSGSHVFVTSHTDVTGFQEALLCGADIVFMADDDTFVAYNLRNGRASDNSLATGRVFAALLDCASGGVQDDVLVLGAGKVGEGACAYLNERGLPFRWFDVRPDVPAVFEADKREGDWSKRSWRYIIEATTSGGLVEAGQVTPESIVAAPGMPFGLTAEAAAKAHVVIHDNLALGTLAMFCEVGCPPSQPAR